MAEPNGSPPFVYVSNQQIFATLQAVERNVDELVRVNADSRLRALEKFKNGVMAVLAVAVPALPVITFLLTRPK